MKQKYMRKALELFLCFSHMLSISILPTPPSKSTEIPWPPSFTYVNVYRPFAMCSAHGLPGGFQLGCEMTYARVEI